MLKLLKYVFLMGMLAGAIFLLNGNIDLEEKEEDPKEFTIAFYNVENLFDTINDPKSNDDKFLPKSKAGWTAERYKRKVKNLSKVIDELGDSNGPEIIGLSEVENGLVLKDLIKSEILRDRGYNIIQFDSKDKRGIDVAFLYKKNSFTPYSSIPKTLVVPDRKSFKTRDVLVVSGMIGKDTVHLILNHWPSRLGGQEKSEGNRIMVAKFVRSIIDSIYTSSAKANIIVMGDFNDEPSNKSIEQQLMAKGDLEACKQNNLFNPFYSIMKEGRGTYKYEGQWDLLDQIMISKEVMQNSNGIKYKSKSANIYDPIWMYYKKSTNHGPYRTYVGSKYYGGYSDHFPVYIQLTREINK